MTLICPSCGREIEISQAVSREIEEKIRSAVTAESDKRIKELTGQLGQVLEQVRMMKKREQEIEVEIQKKIMTAEEKTRQEMNKKAEEELNLKSLELKKQLEDALKVNEELKRKLQQGSSQTQGEVLELELFKLLTSQFPGDRISVVGNGVWGGHVVQEVVDKYGRSCGMILWEAKNAKWSEVWVEKLLADKREAKADVGILVSVNLPAEIKNFGYRRGVWVANWESVTGLAWAVRVGLAQVFSAKLANVGKNEKMEVLYSYVTGTEFRNRVEGIMTAFNGLLDELEREKRWFETKWARQEKHIRSIVSHTHGMFGEIQAISGGGLRMIGEGAEGDGED